MPTCSTSKRRAARRPACSSIRSSSASISTASAIASASPSVELSPKSRSEMSLVQGATCNPFLGLNSLGSRLVGRGSDLVMDGWWNQDIIVQVLEQVQMPDGIQIDDWRGVADDRHNRPSLHNVSTSSSRSSTS